MHIAFVVSTFPALSHTFIDSQIRGLLAAGHRISVHAFARPGQDLTHGYWADVASRLAVHYGIVQPVRPWKRALMAVLLAPRFLNQPGLYLRALFRRPPHGFERRFDALYWSLPLLPALDADALVCHFGDVGLRAFAVRQLARCRGRFVVFFHGADITRFVETHGPGVYRDLLENVDLCLPISDRWRQRLLEMGARPERTHIHHMGVDCGSFAFQRRDLPAFGPIRIVSVARLVEKKGIEYAIRAIAELPAGLRERIEYRIAGDGPLSGRLQSVIREAGVGRQVTLLGWRDHAQVMEEVRTAHLMLVPSVTAADGDQEGIPVSAMEAMATGLPVVATRHSGIPELIADGINGRLVAERDASGLARAIASTLSDTGGYGALAVAARETIATAFNNVRLNAELETLLGADGQP